MGVSEILTEIVAVRERQYERSAKLFNNNAISAEAHDIALVALLDAQLALAREEFRVTDVAKES